jgi:hypothetical protein
MSNDSEMWHAEAVVRLRRIMRGRPEPTRLERWWRAIVARLRPAREA